MKLQFLSFTDRGEALAERLAHSMGGAATRCGRGISLHEWTERGFLEADGLVFIGAVGIAVRAVAPFLKSKAKDPAVVVLDETGTFAIPVLSGHLGGANELAERAAALCGATPVITTATDRNGVFPVDLWAKANNCVILNPERIKRISSRLLAGGQVPYQSDWPIAGASPHGIISGPGDGFRVSVRSTDGPGLRLVPQIAVLGVGCRRGTEKEALEESFERLIAAQKLSREAFFRVCTIDRKKDEPGLLAFCQANNWELIAYSSDELNAVRGTFSSSDFVRKTVGVDNVCERSAVLGSKGKLLCAKQAANGVTMAVALRPFHPSWRWRYG